MSNREETYLTREGKAELEKELKELLEVKRPALAEKLKEAISQGDLSENADYQDAKEQQAHLEGRIRYLENLLRGARIIEESNSSGIVVIGSEVTVVEKGEDIEESYRIVGPAEANPMKGSISYESPLGAALLDKKKGQKVKIATPDGITEFRIKNIK